MTPPRPYRYRLVDVFTNQPLEGNPLAVFPDAQGLSPTTMRKIARELNLSETTFVLPSTRADCAAQVRIFTPAHEMEFAGHPTLGTAWVLINEGRIAKDHTQFSFEERVGAVPVRIERTTQPMLWLTTPAITFGAVVGLEACAELVGLSLQDFLDASPQHVSAGNPTLVIAVRDRQAVDRATLNPAVLQALKEEGDTVFCVFVFAPTPSGAYSRMFAPDYGIPEDPATGSATGPLAAFMMKHDLVSKEAGTHFVSEQGTKMGRRSLLHVLIGDESPIPRIEVGGQVAPIAEGTMTL
jgi:trans-2,3-dihydro-3-hydroxyanthranilate isomerase